MATILIIIKKFKVILIKMAKIKIVIIISINKANIIVNLANIIIIIMAIIMIVNSRYFMALAKVLFIQLIDLAILVSVTFIFKN